MSEITKKRYDHETRKCEYPGCENLGGLGSKHADGTRYRRAWCKKHLKKSGRLERMKLAAGNKKYYPDRIKKSLTK